MLVLKDKKDLDNKYNPVVRTSIPGPESLKLLMSQRRFESSAVTYPNNIQIAIKQAIGTYVIDMDDNTYIDFLSGAGVLSLGHNHEKLKEVAKSQLDTLSHGLDFNTPIKDEFIKAQISMLPTNMQENMKIHFCGPTGADAVETAIKMAKKHTKRGSIVSFQGGYHGCTNGAMSLTGLVSPKEDVQNNMAGVHFFPFAYCLRCPLGLDKNSCDTNCANYFTNSLDDPNGGVEKPAAIILEIVQGEGGSIVAPKEFIQKIRKYTKDNDILMIVDEVQTGCGRTGTWFAFEQYDIEPDIIVVSKGVSGIGFPMSFIMYNTSIRNWSKGSHIGTFRGNQLAFATGAEAVNIFRSEKILENVNIQSAIIFNKLKSELKNCSIIGEIRGIGLMIGIEVIDSNTLKRSQALARAIQKECLINGLIIETGGRNDSVLRLLPPLNINATDVSLAINILCESINQIALNEKQTKDSAEMYYEI